MESTRFCQPEVSPVSDLQPWKHKTLFVLKEDPTNSETMQKTMEKERLLIKCFIDSAICLGTMEFCLFYRKKYDIFGIYLSKDIAECYKKKP